MTGHELDERICNQMWRQFWMKTYFWLLIIFSLVAMIWWVSDAVVCR